MSKENYEIIAAIEDLSGLKFKGNDDNDAKIFIEKYKHYLWDYANFVSE